VFDYIPSPVLLNFSCSLQHGPNQHIQCAYNKVRFLVLSQHMKFKYRAKNSWLSVLLTFVITINATICDRNINPPPLGEVLTLTISKDSGLVININSITFYVSWFRTGCFAIVTSVDTCGC